MIASFTCERYFYYSRKGNRLISPEEQRRIAHVFRSTGLGMTPKFDDYEYVIEWRAYNYVDAHLSIWENGGMTEGILL